MFLPAGSDGRTAVGDVKVDAGSRVWLADAFHGRVLVYSEANEWREYAAAGLGVSACPASAERRYARPGLAFIPTTDAEPARLSVAWRDADT